MYRDGGGWQKNRRIRLFEEDHRFRKGRDAMGGGEHHVATDDDAGAEACALGVTCQNHQRMGRHWAIQVALANEGLRWAACKASPQNKCGEACVNQSHGVPLRSSYLELRWRSNDPDSCHRTLG